MNRVILLVFSVLVFSVLVFSVSDAVGNEYILRIDTIGYFEEPTSAIEPEETTLKSIEVVVRPDFPFHARVRLGADAIVLSGEIHPAKNGDFVVEFKYKHPVYGTLTVAGKNESHEVMVRSTGAERKLTLSIDIAQEIGSHNVQSSSPGKQTLTSKSRIAVTLVKYDPLSD